VGEKLLYRTHLNRAAAAAVTPPVVRERLVLQLLRGEVDLQLRQLFFDSDLIVHDAVVPRRHLADDLPVELHLGRDDGIFRDGRFLRRGFARL
jgi:hypothetical protein